MVKTNTRAVALTEKTILPWRHIKQTAHITVEQKPFETTPMEYAS